MAIRMKYGDFPVSTFIIFPLNYGTIPQAEKQEHEASFCLDEAPSSMPLPGLMVPGFSPGRGRGRGHSSAQEPPQASWTELEVDCLPTPSAHPYHSICSLEPRSFPF